MAQVQTRQQGDEIQFFLSGRALSNGDEVELQLRGNKGWTLVTIDGLPGDIRVRWAGDDGQPLQATLPMQTELRWP